MVDAEDDFAMPLARNGDALPVTGVVESDERFSVEWTHRFTIDGAMFVTIEKKTGRVTSVVGYPVGELALQRERLRRRGPRATR
jgi:hypothetical protein